MWAETTASLYVLIGSGRPTPGTDCSRDKSVTATSSVTSGNDCEQMQDSRSRWHRPCRIRRDLARSQLGKNPQCRLTFHSGKAGFAPASKLFQISYVSTFHRVVVVAPVPALSGSLGQWNQYSSSCLLSLGRAAVPPRTETSQCAQKQTIYFNSNA